MISPIGTIGVVIPVYNKRRFIERAVDSVLAQSDQDFIVNLVDDGSTDGGAEHVRQLADPRIRVLHTTRLGPGGARNAGIAASATEWIALLDGDDAWRKDFLRETRRAAERNPGLVAVFTDVDVPGAVRAPRGVASSLIADYHGARLTSQIAMSSSSIMLRKSALLSAGGFHVDCAYAEDIDAWFRLTCEGPSYYVAEPLARIEIEDPSSATRTTTSLERVRGLQLLQASYARHRDEGRIPVASRRSCRRFMQHQRGRLSVHMIRAGNRAAALRLLVTSVPLNRHTWRDYRDVALGALRALRSHDA